MAGENKTEKKLKVTLVKSGIGRTQRQKNTIKALGLTKLNQTREIPDSPQVRGMVKKILHLVKFEEVI